jgi:hypothetical protein
MANQILVEVGTQLVWANAGDFGNSPIADTDQINLTSLGSGAAREGDKGNLGDPRAAQYAVTLRVELNVAPTSPGAGYSLWWAASPAAAAATANPGGVSGSDGAYTGTAGDSLADSIKQLTLIGVCAPTSDADGVIQQATWVFSPEHQYGTPVVYNESDQAFEGDGVEMSIIFEPIVDEVQ